MRWRQSLFNPMVTVAAALLIGGMAYTPLLSPTSSTSLSLDSVAPTGEVSPTVSELNAYGASGHATPPSAEPTAAQMVTPATPSPIPLPAPTNTPSPIVSPDLTTTSATAQTAPVPVPQQPATRGQQRQAKIGIQAGHWRVAEHPDELASLRGATGAEGTGWKEREVNLDIVRRVAGILEVEGFQVDVLPATVPPQYKADVFLSLHGDGNQSNTLRGYKAARALRSAIPAIDDALVAAIYQNYGRITGLPRHDKSITNNMLYYYAFAGGKIKHSVAPTTPAAILEMGFLTNPTDRNLLLNSPDLVAKAITASILGFLNH